MKTPKLNYKIGSKNPSEKVLASRVKEESKTAREYASEGYVSQAKDEARHSAFFEEELEKKKGLADVDEPSNYDKALYFKKKLVEEVRKPEPDSDAVKYYQKEFREYRAKTGKTYFYPKK